MYIEDRPGAPKGTAALELFSQEFVLAVVSEPPCVWLKFVLEVPGEDLLLCARK